MIIAKKSIKTFILSMLLSVSLVGSLFAQGHGEETSHANDKSSHHEEEKFNPSEFINDHIADAHEFHIADWGGHAISMPLPVILWTDNGLVTFMSTEFGHGKYRDVKASEFTRTDHHRKIVEKNGMKFEMVNGNIYYADKVADIHPADLKDLAKAFDFGIRPINLSPTKNAFSMVLSVIFLFLIFSKVGKSYKKNKMAPKGIAGFMEPLVIFVRDDIAIPNIGAKKYAKFMPYLLTIFFFIWINNLIGLIPFFPFSSNLTGNLAFTFTLAFITFLITSFNGNKNYWGHIFAPPVPKALWFLMIPVEIIGMFTKPFALMVRLFANIAAGHIIILSLVALIFIFKTVFIAPVSGAFVIFMSFLELLVAALQAYVFTLLSALFIGQAVDDHH
ncbi:F0F1 ATP synthase subunit A [Aureivirga sp. CE67]|uniref:F0F1 ATP synthase subunit A n=1 Tax=Aureivirga sp. CE67 TaxID=1788983 RepID=UPI0018CA508D|nr:F0F1 ATP synthase subunit A [Aureivirga sp. CE67]